MRSQQLLWNGQSFHVPREVMFKTLLFNENVELFTHPYTVKSVVDRGQFEAFVQALCGEDIVVNSQNYCGLQKLGEEFGFSELLEEVRLFLQRHAELASPSLAVEIIQKHVRQQDRIIESLRSECADLRRSLTEVQQKLSEVLEKVASPSKHEEKPVKEPPVSKTLPKLVIKSDDKARSSRSHKDAPKQEALARTTSRLSQSSSQVHIGLRSPKTRQSRQIAYDETRDPFDGIIALLRSEIGGDLVEMGVISVTDRDRQMTPQVWARNVVDGQASTCYVSSDEEGAWFRLRFAHRYVRPEAYSLRSGMSGAYIKSWILEGSTEGVNWTELDRQENTNALMGKFSAATFKLQRKAPACRYIRVRMIGTNALNSHFFLCSGFEVFGVLTE